jgi:alpha-amylase/alpha-mannosidase (GH57 family)
VAFGRVMKKLYLQFIWHMHQPCYKDPETGQYLLPWVFLHGTKDYLEIPRYYELYNAKGTFNFVPSLLRQIKDYYSLDVNDRLIKLIKANDKFLPEKDYEFLVPVLFMANLQNMISRSDRYKELYEKFSNDRHSRFNYQELLDLKVQFLLAWTGEFIREESSLIKSLIVKDRDFNEDEKDSLLKILTGKIGYIFDYYKKLYSNNKIELSVTPYYHPIFPLLLDMKSALEVKRDIKIPENAFSLEDDAIWNLTEGLKEFEKYFGIKPKGVWPAEGSVSNNAVSIFGDYFKWCATDEDVLSNSLKINLKLSENRSNLYKRYIYSDKKISVFFRDKHLSDLIGFVYSKVDAVDAACDFIKKLKNIYDLCEHEPVVTVILDGENAWEFYKKNASDFFHALFERLMKIEWIETVTPTEMIKKNNDNAGKLGNIVAGSWIYGDFTTWVGHPEKNKAWEYVFHVKKDLMNFEKNGSHIKNIDEAKNNLRVAEGSDWFWWYGDDHYTSQAGVFDYLFRSNLIAVYKKIGVNPPSFLYEPIKKQDTASQRIIYPKNFISPVINGVVDNYFEYLGAGEVNLKYDMSSMNIGENILSKMLWGFDRENFYIMLDLKLENLSIEKLFLEIKLFNSNDYFLKYYFGSKNLISNIPEGDFNVSFETVFEMGVSLNLFHSKRVDIFLSVYDEEKLIDKAPLYSPLRLNLYSFNINEWIV